MTIHLLYILIIHLLLFHLFIYMDTEATHIKIIIPEELDVDRPRKRE